MDINEFKHQVIAGEITNFKPYFEKGSPDKINKQKSICITHNVAQELYSEWASTKATTQSELWIHYMLATKGYCLDSLSKSNDDSVCRAVLESNISYALDYHMIKNHKCQINYVLMRKTNIPLKILNRCLNHVGLIYNENTTALEIKQKAIIHEPTPIEKTMTQTQLYATNSPHWALNLTGIQIKQVIDSKDRIHELEKILERS